MDDYTDRNGTPLYVLTKDCNDIYIKREDMIPFCFGGNKARKAQYFFREIGAGGYDCVVTYGSSSSNHCRVVSNMTASRGLKCYIIGPQEASEPTYNSRMMELFGAEITTVPVKEVHDTIEAKLQTLRDSGMRPYFIPGGGHGNLGTQAYVDCYDEIRSWEKAHDVFFDYIFLASGTGTTQAGLVCGQLMHQEKRKIVGISVARKCPYGRDVVMESISDYLEQRGCVIHREAVEEHTIFLDDYTGDGYGKENSGITDVIWKSLLQYGIPMDSTYTAKAFYGMLQYVKREKITGRNLLFIHTGGTPLFFDGIGKLTST